MKVGDRVQLHPATDLWMQGDRYGEIVKVDQASVRVKLDKSGKTVHVFKDNIKEVI